MLLQIAPSSNPQIFCLCDFFSCFDHNMGTAATLVIIYQGKRCFAVTGRYDGMPSEEGCNILEFISNEDQLRQLRAALTRPLLRSALQSEIDVVHDHRSARWSRAAAERDRPSPHPSIMPEHVSEILPLLIRLEGIGVLPVEDNIHDVLNIDTFVYVLDLDSGFFEVYYGLTTTDCVLDDRFQDLPRSSSRQWMTAALLRRWSLSNLPSEDDFIDLTDPNEESEDSDDEAMEPSGSQGCKEAMGG